MATTNDAQDAKEPSIAPGVYRHYKHQNYQVIDVVQHSETREWLVLYKPLYNDSGLWVRPYEMFIETVEHKGEILPRFQKISD